MSVQEFLAWMLISRCKMHGGGSIGRAGTKSAVLVMRWQYAREFPSCFYAWAGLVYYGKCSRKTARPGQ